MAASPEQIAALRAAPCPAYQVNYSRLYSDAKIADARNGYFTVFLSRTRLVPHVNWRQDPVKQKSWRERLHAFDWIDVLFYDYHQTGDQAALVQARDLMLDWIASNPRVGSSAQYAWGLDGNRAAAVRVGYLGYLTREAACQGILSDADASILLDSIKDHGIFLASNAVYRPNNHGLFMDVGLALTARYLSFLSDTDPLGQTADAWQELAAARFLRTLRAHLSNSGVWLEHSTTYQLVARALVVQLSELLDSVPAQLVALRAKMEQATGWFVEPDGYLTQFGDTISLAAPAWLSAIAETQAGLAPLTDAGFGIVKTPTDYLGVTAALWSKVHKHPDDLGFDLYSSGHRIVSEPGFFTNDPSPFRDYAMSGRSHSGLVIDGVGSYAFRRIRPYGSQMLGTGQAGDWYAIEAATGLAKLQRVDARRLFLYWPGHVLVVVDRIRAKSTHRYCRYFQLGKGLQVKRVRRTAYRLRAPGFLGMLSAYRSRASGKSSPKSALRRGYTFPAFRVRERRPSVVYCDKGKNATYVTLFTLDGSARRLRLLSARRQSARVWLSGVGYVRAVRRGRTIAIGRS